MVFRTQKNNNIIQTQLKTIPTEKRSFPGGNNHDGAERDTKKHKKISPDSRRNQDLKKL